MRTDEVVENNKKISEQSLKTATEVERQILSVLTDISETLAMQVDLTANIYGREIFNKKQMEQMRHREMQKQQQMQQMMPQFQMPVPMPGDGKEKQ